MTYTLRISSWVVPSLVVASCFASMSTLQAGKKAPTGEHSPSEEDPVALWSDGQHDAAIDAFIKADWSSGKVFRQSSIFRLKEEDYRSASAAQRKQWDRQIASDTKVLREIARAVLKKADNASSSGQSVKAKEDRTAVLVLRHTNELG